MSKEVNCPIHGTHGNLSNGACFHCVAEGKVVHVPIPEGDHNLEVEVLEENEKYPDPDDVGQVESED